MARLVRRLTETEIDCYDVLPPELARRVVVVQLPVLPGPYAGLTIGPLIVLERPIDPDHPEALLAHELVHVRQFADQGVLKFTVDYNTAFLRNLVRFRRWNRAYRAIPAEEEARAEAGRWLERTFGDRSAL